MYQLHVALHSKGLISLPPLRPLSDKADVTVSYDCASVSVSETSRSLTCRFARKINVGSSGSGRFPSDLCRPDGSLAMDVGFDRACQITKHVIATVIIIIIITGGTVRREAYGNFVYFVV